MAEEKRRDMSKIALEARSFQQQGELMQQQLSTIQGTIIELKATSETLKNIAAIKGKDVLLPMGSGVLSHAKLTGGEKVLVEIGSGIIAEKELGEAAEILQARLKSLEETRDSIQSALREVSEKLRGLDLEARKLMAAEKEG